MNEYIDPPNADELIQKFNTLTDQKEVEDFIETNFPKWIIQSLPNYSKDYYYLDRNWNTICKKLGVKKQKIILVQEIVFDERHRVLNHIAEEITKKGYVVRRFDEFGYCPVCVGAIPCIEIWHLMKEKGLPVPLNWNSFCQGCRKYSSE